MPKLSKLQSGFITGEISKEAFGRTDQARYEMGLETCINYLPIPQGPLIRRPGTKFVTTTKINGQLPVLIPFQFSLNQNYMIEAGDKYFRFYTNEGQIVTSTSTVLVAGVYGQPGNSNGGTAGAFYQFTALRPNGNASPNEWINTSSVLSTGSILELPTPYKFADLKRIRFTQKQDTLYLTHPSYQPYKLVRTGLNTWDLKAVLFQDGPYMPLNSYQSIGDSTAIGLNFVAGIPLPSTYPSNAGLNVSVNTTPVYYIQKITAVGANAAQISIAGIPNIQIGSPRFQTGDKVFIQGVLGTTEINNVTRTDPTTGMITNSSPSQAFWTVVTGNIIGSTFTINAPITNAFTLSSTAQVMPALIQLTSLGNGTSAWADVTTGSSSWFPLLTGLRNFAFYQNGTRSWGHITDVTNTAQFTVQLGYNQIVFAGTSNIWAMGTYNLINGFPAACTFHQDRLVFSGPPTFPQEIDASMSAQYELFSANTASSQVNGNNALQFTLNSQDTNSIRWLKSNSQGLLAGVQTGEWAIAPSSQGAALTPTNITANQVTAFGCADVDALLSGNAALYVQRAQKKVRELLYFWQVGNFRSSNISELAQHITFPAVTQLVNQKEPHAFIWGVRSDGNLVSLTYNRDDVTLQANAGWARHQLGGFGDSAGNPPFVNSVGVMPSGDTTYDQLWMVTKRYINGSTFGVVEYMTKPFDDLTPQEQSYHFDYGGTYNSSVVVSAISTGFACVVTAFNHGFANSSLVRFYGIVGMNQTTTDANGNVGSSNQFNYQTFLVTSTATNTFFLKDFQGNFINTGSSSVYIGSGTVNKLVTSVSGLSWLAGEQVSVLADGGIHVNTSVTQAGVLNLSYPAAVVQVGYQYNSDAKLLRTHEGSAQGTSMGTTRRINWVAFMLHNVGDFSYGPSFTRLLPGEFLLADVNSTDTAPALFDGVERLGLQGPYTYDDSVCIRQNSGLPGMIQAVTRFLEQTDV